MSGRALELGANRQGAFPDRPHRLVIKTLLDGVETPRRVEVRSRRTMAYIISAVTRPNGVVEFRHLPVQSLADPYVVVCFDDRKDEFVNAMIFDRVYQVDDQGYPPDT